MERTEQTVQGNDSVANKTKFNTSHIVHCGKKARGKVTGLIEPPWIKLWLTPKGKIAWEILSRPDHITTFIFHNFVPKSGSIRVWIAVELNSGKIK